MTPTSTLSLRQIIWIEDEADIEALVKQRFRTEIKNKEFDFTFSPDLSSARKLLQNFEVPPLVLCDINLPDGSGIELLEELNQRYGRLALVVMVTANDDMKTIREAMHRGAFDFLSKPLNFDDLHETISRAWKHQASQLLVAKEHEELNRLEYQLQIARDIQMGLLNPESQFKNLGNNISANAVFIPARELGGIMYDYRVLDNKRHMAFMAAVSDTGLSGALYMATVQSIVQTLLYSSNLDSAAQVLHLLNKVLYKNNTTGHFITCFLGIISPQKGSMSYVSAGHRPPLILSSDGSMEVMESTPDMPLGLKPELHFREQWQFLKPGQTVLIYSHGASEIHNKSREVLGDQGFRDLAKKAALESRESREILEKVTRGLRDYAGEFQLSEDLALLALSYLSSE